MHYVFKSKDSGIVTSHRFAEDWRQWEVSNILGVEVSRIKLPHDTNQIVVSLIGWQTGIYLFRINGIEGHSPRSKLIIAR